MAWADDVFIYSSSNQFRGLNITQQTDTLLTTTPIAAAVNALAFNTQAGLMYYGDGTRVYRWRPSLGAGAAAHQLMNDFSTGPVTAAIRNLNSTAGSYLDGKYYVGSEAPTGEIDDVYELTMSIDGTQVVSARALDILSACNCSSTDLGGFGDIAAIAEGGQTVLYGSSARLGGTATGGSAGIWRYVPATQSFTLLGPQTRGQMSNGPNDRLYSNIGNSVREVNKSTGQVGNTSLITTTAPIFDFTGSYQIDFGDAADSYGAAFHRNESGVPLTFIGANAPDNEAASQNAVSGGTDLTGDDLIGIDDEDAIDSAPPIPATGGEYSLTMQCTAGARVAGWIDADINGRFDFDERNDNHPVSCSGGSATLIWRNLDRVGGSSTLRLRASTNAASVSVPTGVAPDGEVEDHPITINAPLQTGSCPAGDLSTVYTAGDLPRSIGPNRNTVTVSTITVPDSVTVTDVNVLAVQGRHTYINDLFFDLRHNGVTRRLYGPSCGSQNNFAFGFDDQSSGTPPCPPIDGQSYPPVRGLDAFAGQNASGNWQLRITDRFNGDAGVLDEWALEICSTPVVAEAPDIRLGKSAQVENRTVTMTLQMLNAGNTDLSALALDDALDPVFGVDNYTIVQPPTVIDGPTGFGGNAGFTGQSGNTALLSSAGVLAPDETLTLEFAVRVDAFDGGFDAGVYQNQAEVSASSPGGSIVSDLSGNGLDLSNDDDAPTPIIVEVRSLVSGQVFIDTSPDANTAHDGVRQTGEQSVSGRQVRARDPSGTVIAVTATDGAGRYEFSFDSSLSGQSIGIEVTPDGNSRLVSEAPSHTTGAVNDGVITLIPAVGSTIEGVDFGVVGAPTLTLDQSGSGAPGTPVRYAHRFVSPSHGVLEWVLAGGASPAQPAWPMRLIRDTDCDGVIDTGEQAVSGTETVAFDTRVCVVVDLFIPARASSGASHGIVLSANLTLDDRSGTGHATRFERVNRDTTRVVFRGNGRLVLDKSVRNLTRGEPLSASNSALPGHVLEYRIDYRNQGDGPIDELIIDDSAPAFTRIVPGSVTCESTPASLQCLPAFAGDSVSWDFDGILGSGESGSVRYRVAIE